MRAEAVVVQVEVLQGHVGGEESHERGLGVETEGVVVEVDGGEVGMVQDSGENGRDAGGNLVEQSAGEEIGEVCRLCFVVMLATAVAFSCFKEGHLGRLHYLEALLGGKDFTKALARTNTQRVSQEANLLDVLERDQRSNVRLDVLGGVELEPLALKGEDLGRGHFAGERKCGKLMRMMMMSSR